MEEYSEEDYNNLLNDPVYSDKYEEYKEKNKSIKDFNNFLNSIELNTKYFRLTTNSKIGKNKFYRNKNISKDTLSIKEINSYLNKLTENNTDKIIENIKVRLDNKSYLNDMIIENILSKCIQQPSYINCYIEVLLNIFHNYERLYEKIEGSVDILYEKIMKDTDEVEASEYLQFCAKNKKLDLLIGYSILITELEKKSIFDDKIHKFLNFFLDIIDNHENMDERYRGVQCLYNIFKSYYEEDTELPQGFIDKLNLLKNKEKSMKIKFKLMDILERK